MDGQWAAITDNLAAAPSAWLMFMQITGNLVLLGDGTRKLLELDDDGRTAFLDYL